MVTPPAVTTNAQSLHGDNHCDRLGYSIENPYPPEDFGKVYRGSVNFKCTYLLCDFLIRFITEGVIFYLEVPNELIYLEFTV